LRALVAASPMVEVQAVASLGFRALVAVLPMWTGWFRARRRVADGRVQAVALGFRAMAASPQAEQDDALGIVLGSGRSSLGDHWRSSGYARSACDVVDRDARPYVHLVWATRTRPLWIDRSVAAARIDGPGVVSSWAGVAVAIGGVEDHACTRLR